MPSSLPPDPDAAPESASAPPVFPALPRAVVLLLGLAGATVVVAGLRGVSDLLGPAFLSLVLTIAAFPLKRWLERFVPAWAAALACLLTVYLLVVALAVTVVVSIAQFASLLPQYEDEFKDLIGSIGDQLHRLGVDAKQVQDLTSSFDLSSLGGLVSDILGAAVGLVSNLAFILTLILFMTVDANQFPRHLRNAKAARPAIIDALVNFAVATRSYLVVSTVFGLIVAVLDTIALELLGVPGALLWGVLAFLTNYIPNIGFVIGLIPPAILALLEGGPGMMLAVIAVYVALNVVIQSVIQPKVVGDAVGLSTTLTFLSLVFWSWVMGPIGAIMAIPLSLLARAILVDADPGSSWLIPLVSNSDGTKPPKKTRKKRMMKRRSVGDRDDLHDADAQ